MPIDRLIVIGGPKAVGKSLLIKRLQRQALPQLAEALRLGDPGAWRYAAALEFEEEHDRMRIKDSPIDRMVLHYEITRPWSRRYQYGFIEDEPLRVLRFSQDITFVTLWAPCDVLLERFLARNPRFANKLTWLRAIWHHGFRNPLLDADFRPLYRNPAEVFRVYENWIEFCRITATEEHWLVNSSDGRFASALLTRFPDDLVSQINAWSRERGVSRGESYISQSSSL